MGKPKDDSRFHDLLGAGLGLLAAVFLVASPWQIDTTGPDPFYKGPLIYPLMVLILMILSSLPSVIRLLRPRPGSSWLLDGEGPPRKTLVILIFLLAFLPALLFFGLEISASAFLVASLYYLGHRSLKRLVLVPLLTVGLTAVVFKYLLQVYFPTPILWELMGW